MGVADLASKNTSSSTTSAITTTMSFLTSQCSPAQQISRSRGSPTGSLQSSFVCHRSVLANEPESQRRQLADR